MDDDAPGDAGGQGQHRLVSRRALLASGGVLGLGAAVAATTGGGVAYADTATRRSRAVAADHLPQMPVRSEVVWGLGGTERLLALTFDDGPDPRHTGAVLDALARAGAKATFFQIGYRAAAHPDLVKRVADAGHEIGNHTWHHDDLSAGDYAQAKDHLGRTSEVLHQLTGAAPTIMRPPWGRLNGGALQAAAELDLSVVLWQQRFQSQLGTAANVDWVTSRLAPGVVVLSHDGGPVPNPALMAALPRVLAEAQEAGYRLVTISEGLSATGATSSGP